MLLVWRHETLADDAFLPTNSRFKVRLGCMLRLSLRTLVSVPVDSPCWTRRALGVSRALGTMTSPPSFIDIGVNLTDPVFRGSYHGKQAHEDDLDVVCQRAAEAGVVAQLLTGGNLAESREALELARRSDCFYSTAGCHPTRTSEMEAHEHGADAYLDKIRQLILGDTARKIRAVGECGLDYDRLHFSPAEVQKRHFATQLELAIQVKLPLFLHSRAAHADFVDILSPSIHDLHSALSQDAQPHQLDPLAKRVGVVHSFTGTIHEVDQLLALGLFIGINGCSLKTQDNLAVLHRIPLSRLMLETDAPWCDPRPTHASHAYIQAFKASNADLHARYQPRALKKEKWSAQSMVKGRNEPCTIGLIAATVAGVKQVSFQEVADAATYNTRWLFDLP